MNRIVRYEMQLKMKRLAYLATKATSTFLETSTANTGNNSSFFLILESGNKILVSIYFKI